MELQLNGCYSKNENNFIYKSLVEIGLDLHGNLRVKKSYKFL